MTLLGVTPAGPSCDCPGPLHLVTCPAVAAGQPQAMVNDDGEVFYPDGPEDADWFAAHHEARPLDPR